MRLELAVLINLAINSNGLKMELADEEYSIPHGKVAKMKVKHVTEAYDVWDYKDHGAYWRMRIDQVEKVSEDPNYKTFVEQALTEAGMKPLNHRHIDLWGADHGVYGQAQKCDPIPKELQGKAKTLAKTMDIPYKFVNECHHVQYGLGWAQGNYELGLLKHVVDLKPEHTLFDVGCGSLRMGIHAIDYLNEGNFYGLDPDEFSLRAGMQYEVPIHNLTSKRPHLLVNSQFAMDKIASQGSIDVISFFVVLKKVQFLQPAFTHAAKVLKPTGRIVVVSDHSDPQYSQPGAFMSALSKAGLTIDESNADTHVRKTHLLKGSGLMGGGKGWKVTVIKKK